MAYNNKEQYFQLIKEYQSKPSDSRLKEMIQYVENNFTAEQRVKYNNEYYGIQ